MANTLSQSPGRRSASYDRLRRARGGHQRRRSASTDSSSYGSDSSLASEDARRSRRHSRQIVQNFYNMGPHPLSVSSYPTQQVTPAQQSYPYPSRGTTSPSMSTRSIESSTRPPTRPPTTRKASLPTYEGIAPPIRAQTSHHQGSKRGHKRTHSDADREVALGSTASAHYVSAPHSEPYVAARSTTRGNTILASPHGSPPLPSAERNQYFPPAEPETPQLHISTSPPKTLPLAEPRVLSPISGPSPNLGTNEAAGSPPSASDHLKKPKKSSSLGGKENKDTAQAAYEAKILEQVYEKELRGMVKDALSSSSSAPAHASAKIDDKAAEHISEMILHMAAELEISDLQDGVADVLASVALDAVREINESQSASAPSADAVIRARVVARFVDVWAKTNSNVSKSLIREGKNLVFLVAALNRSAIITVNELYSCLRVLMDTISRSSDVSGPLDALRNLLLHADNQLFCGDMNAQKLKDMKRKLRTMFEDGKDGANAQFSRNVNKVIKDRLREHKSTLTRTRDSNTPPANGIGDPSDNRASSLSPKSRKLDSLV